VGFFGADHDGDDAGEIYDREGHERTDIEENGLPTLHALPVHQEDGGEEHGEDLDVFDAGTLPGDGDVRGGSDDVVAERDRTGHEKCRGASPIGAKLGPVGVDQERHGYDEQCEKNDQDVAADFHRVVSLSSAITNRPIKSVKSAWWPENSSPEICPGGGAGGPDGGGGGAVVIGGGVTGGGGGVPGGGGGVLPDGGGVTVAGGGTITAGGGGVL